MIYVITLINYFIDKNVNLTNEILTTIFSLEISLF